MSFRVGETQRFGYDVQIAAASDGLAAVDAAAIVNVEWDGIVSISNFNTGAEVANVTITSASGTDYRKRIGVANSSLWSAGEDLRKNEVADAAAEANPRNATVSQWTYGFRTTAAGNALQLFDVAQHQNGVGHPEVDGWIPGAGVLVNTGSGAVPVSLGGSASKPVLPGQLLMQPTATEFAVARWTAPASGTYNIAARWVDVQTGSGNGATAHVVVNGQQIFGGQSAPGSKSFIGGNWKDGGEIAMAPKPVRLDAGATVDFVVGSRGDAVADLTAMNTVIRRAPYVTLTAGTLPCSFDPQSQTSSCTATEGQPILITADSPDTLTTVAMWRDGAVEASQSGGPYEFPLNGLTPGEYYLEAEAKGSDGIVGASNAIKLTVNSSNATARRGAKAATAGAEYVAITGVWSDPNTWTRKSDGAMGVGVPGPGDVAFIPDGVQVTVTEDTTVSKLFTAGLLRGATESADHELVITGQCDISGSVKSLVLKVPPGGLLTAIKGTTSLENVELLSSGEVRFTRSVFGASSSIASTGKTALLTPPASGGPVILQGQRIDIKGLASAAPGTAIAGLIGLDGGTLIGNDGSTLIGNDGSTLIGNDGSTLIGNDGSTLIGNDGSTLIGNDGSTLIGNDGSTLIGNDGSTLIGNDGSTLGQINAAALIGNDGSTIEKSAHSGSKSVELDRKAAVTSNATTLTNGSTLGGDCNVIGALRNESGFVMPGNSAGRIVVAGNYTQTANGGLVLETGGTTAGAFDRLDVLGTAALGGKLIVKAIDGFTPGGEAFAPLTYGAVSGQFDSVSSNAQVSFGAKGMTTQVSGPNPPAPKALNIATRMRVETGDNVLIAGFIITGNSAKKVLVRGIGPSLPVGGALADPTLDLDGGAFVNDDWRSDQQGEIEGTTIPPSSDLESAIVATLEPGAHTAVLRGKNNGTGVGLVEVYDLETGSPVQLANISTRGQVQTGDNVMIGGFIIGGDYPAKVLLRAIGPSLPVEGALQNPTLELVDGQGNTISNDDWRATQESEIIGTTVPPTSDREAAIVATLAPGAYTAVVRGKDDTVGVALVEGYNLP